MLDFEKVYRSYFEDVYYFVLALARDPLVTEEITSQTFFKALQNITKLRKEESLKSYLFSIAKHTYYDYLKSKSREAGNMEDLELADSDPSPADVLMTDEKTRLFKQAIATLPEPGQSILKLRIYEELSYQDIATIYGKSENWACVTFYRAKQKLKKIWEEEYEQL